jgi:hypothetical protein
MKGLDIVDTPRAFIAAGIKDIVDDNGSVDMGQIWDDAMRNISFQEATGLSETNLPGAAKFGLGFLGDIATDPLTYTGVGIMAKAGAVGIDGANAVVQAAKYGSRKELAQAVATESVKHEFDEVGQRVIRELTQNAASRGRGAFTRRGLSRIGVDEATVREVVEKIGADLEFSYGLRYGRNVAGSNSVTRGVAEGVADIKGELLRGVFGSKVARELRPWFLSSRSNYNQIVNSLLSNTAEDPVQAALDLSRIEAARGFSRQFVDANVRNQRNVFGDRLRKLSTDERSALRDDLERQLIDPDAAPTTELGAQMRKEFDSLFNQLSKAGVTVDYRQGYLPHFLTPEGKRWAAQNAETYKMILGKSDTPSFFQKARQIQAGARIGNTTLKEGTVREINEVAKRELGIDRLLEDDPLRMLAHYTQQAGTSVYERSLLDMAAKYGMGADIPLTTVKRPLAEVDPTGARLIEDAAAGQNAAARQADTTAFGATQEAVASRQAALDTMQRGLQEDVDTSTEIIGQFEREAAQASQDYEAAAADLITSRDASLAADREVKTLGRAARLARAAHNKKWNRVVNDLDAKVLVLLRKREDEVARLMDGGMTIDQAVSEETVSSLDEAIAKARGSAWEARQSRDALSPEEQALEIAQRTQERAAETFAQADDVHAAAKNRLAWINADLPTVRAQHAKILGAYEAGDFPKPRGMNPKTWRDNNDLLREHVARVNEMLNDPAFDGVPFLDRMRRAEANASEFDMLALKQRRQGNVARDTEKAFQDRLFVDDQMRQLSEGFIQYSDTYQLPQDVRDRLAYEVKTVQERLASQPQILTQVAQVYDQILNLWKSWAVATPGFIARNLYGGLFNMMVLDGVDFRSISDFRGVLARYRQNPQGNWMEEAADYLVSRKNPTHLAWRSEARAAGMGPVEYARAQVRLMQDAFDAAASTGFGVNVAEVGRAATIEGRNLNPFSSEFALTSRVRQGSQWAEELMRGSHAWDVLRKGGTKDSAVARIQKFHFNYEDIGAFDRVAKKVIPFWTFWSRNLPMQAQMWVRSPQKINQSIINARRNMEMLSSPDETKPEWFDTMGLMRTPLETDDGGHWYGGLDLPTMRLPDDIDRLVNLKDNPLGPLADAAPWFKLPAEMAFNKNSFYNTEFKNLPYEYASDGSLRFRSAPVPLDLPVVRNLAALLPGIDLQNDGTLTITDKAEHVLDQVPAMRYQNIIVPEDRDESAQAGRAVSALFGVQFRPNTKEAQQRQAYYESLDEREQARVDAIIRSLGGS